MSTVSDEHLALGHNGVVSFESRSVLCESAVKVITYSTLIVVTRVSGCLKFDGLNDYGFP